MKPNKSLKAPTPLVSVLMPVYNCQEHVAEAVDSILSQTFPDFEFVIVNDGSTDKTVDIIQSYNDPRIELFHMEENSGVAAALNAGLDVCRGEFIARMDGDDWCHPERIEKQYYFLKSNPDFGMVRSLIEFVPLNDTVQKTSRFSRFKNVVEHQRNDGRTWEDIHKKLYMYLCIQHGAVMIKSDIFKTMKYAKLETGEDYKLFYDINRQNIKIETINTVHLKVKVGDETASAVNQDYYPGIVFETIKYREIKKLFAAGNQVYIWGTGSQSQILLSFCEKHQFEIGGFINFKKDSKSFCGLPVDSPTQWINRPGIKKVLIAAQPIRQKVVSYLEDNGYKHLDDFLVYV